MAERVDCVLHLVGTLARTAIPDLLSVFDDMGQSPYGYGDLDAYIANGNGVIDFPEMKYGNMPDAVAAALTKLGLSWAWHHNAGCDFPEGVEFHDAELGEDDFRICGCEILLTIEDATDPETLATAQRWAAFWEATGPITITDDNQRGGETNTEELD